MTSFFGISVSLESKGLQFIEGRIIDASFVIALANVTPVMKKADKTGSG